LKQSNNSFEEDKMIKVLIADDSPTCRSLLRRLLQPDDGFGVIGEARDGAEAVRLTATLKPDVIVMDLIMPGLDGLEATGRIMSDTPTPIVLVSSSKTIHESTFAMKALECGALSVIDKPAMTADLERAEVIIEEFQKAVRLMSSVPVIKRRQIVGVTCTTTVAETGLARTHFSSVSDSKLPRHMPVHRPKAIAVATSTGGPPALARIAAGLPANFDIPIMVVQHIGAGFLDGMISWMSRESPLQVKEGAAGMALEGGTIYIAPDGAHMGATEDMRIKLSAAAPIRGFRPSGTYLFESVASAFGPNCLSLILTGMGDDGVAGLAEVKRAGGFVVAQDETTSTVFGMPAKAIECGHADVILPLDSIPMFLKEVAGL